MANESAQDRHWRLAQARYDADEEIAIVTWCYNRYLNKGSPVPVDLAATWIRKARSPTSSPSPSSTPTSTTSTSGPAPPSPVSLCEMAKLPALTPLQQRWTNIYRESLPSIARRLHAKSSKVPWPVQLDHCFARIILDIAIGVSQPWHQVIKAPATRNMSEEQLKRAIALGEKIAKDEVDLWELDAKSLELRGKQQKAGAFLLGKRKREEAEQRPPNAAEKSRRVETWLSSQDKDNPQGRTTGGEPSATTAAASKSSRQATMAQAWSGFSAKQEDGKTDAQALEDDAAVRAKVRKVIDSNTEFTPFRKLVMSLLTQVPRGSYTTYQAMANAALEFSPNSAPNSGKPTATRGCARAIGGAMRNNPYAPQAPCHRVLASDGKIGGFNGDWGAEGRFAGEKARLLKEEGIRFDGKGKVIGEPFRGFVKP